MYLRMDVDQHGTAAAPLFHPDDDEYELLYMPGDEMDTAHGGEPALMPLPGRVDLEGIEPGMLVCIRRDKELGPDNLLWITDKSYWAVVGRSGREFVLASPVPNSGRNTRLWLRSPAGRRALALEATLVASKDEEPISE